jgi:hypothetical protein
MKEREKLEEVYKVLGCTPAQRARIRRLSRNFNPDIPDNPEADRELKRAIFFWNQVFLQAALPQLIPSLEIASATDRWFRQVSGREAE